MIIRNIQILLVFSILLISQGLALAREIDVPPRVTPHPITEKYINNPVFDCKTYIRESGKQNSQTLILVPGIGDEASLILDDLMVFLAEKFHVISFDFPGFGRSEKSNTLYSPERYGEFIHWLIKGNTSTPVILLGHSMGGALALRYASTYPETVKHLIIVDAAAILHRIAISKNFVHIEEPNSQQRGLAGLITRPFEKPLHALNHLVGTTVEKLEFPKTDEGLDFIIGYKGLRKMFLGGNPRTIAGLALVQENFTEHIGKNNVPTSIIWGRNDDISPLRTGKLLAGKLPQSRLRIIEKAGHVPMREQEAEFNRVLLAEINTPPTGTENEIPAENAMRTGFCKQQSDLVFTGHFDRIMIDGCYRIMIKDATAQFIGIKRSEVIIEDTAVKGTDIALDLVHSKVIGTNVLFDGVTAIRSSGSRLDLAGAQVTGSKAAVATPDKTVVLFSVSTVSSPHTAGSLHGVYRLNAEKSL